MWYAFFYDLVISNVLYLLGLNFTLRYYQNKWPQASISTHNKYEQYISCIYCPFFWPFSHKTIPNLFYVSFMFFLHLNVLKCKENTYFFILVVETFMTRVEKHFPLPLASNIWLLGKKKNQIRIPIFFTGMTSWSISVSHCNQYCWYFQSKKTVTSHLFEFFCEWLTKL